MSEKFINIGNKNFTNVDKIKHIIAADADNVRRFLKKHNLDRTSMQVIDVTGDKEVRSMLLLDDNSITLSSVSSTSLSKRASAYMETEDNEE